MDTNSASAIAAWWGAIVATLLGLIKFHQWWTQDRPKFSIRLYRGDVLSQETDQQGYPLKKENIFIEIVNDGKDVVIQKVCIEEYPRRAGSFQSEYKWTVFYDYSDYNESSFELGTGKLWRGSATPDFTDRYNQTVDKSNVFVTIYHAGKKSPYRQKTPVLIETQSKPVG